MEVDRRNIKGGSCSASYRAGNIIGRALRRMRRKALCKLPKYFIVMVKIF